MASLKLVCWMCLVFGGVAISFTAGAPAEDDLLAAPTAPDNINGTTEGKVTGTTVNVTATTANVTEVTTNNATVSNATTEPPTTAHSTTHNINGTTEVTTFNGTTDNVTTTMPSNVTTVPLNVTTEPVHTSHGPSSPSTPQTTTPKSSKSGFDVASFFGGVATAIGLAIIIFIGVCCYNKTRKNSYHAM